MSVGKDEVITTAAVVGAAVLGAAAAGPIGATAAATAAGVATNRALHANSSSDES